MLVLELTRNLGSTKKKKKNQSLALKTYPQNNKKSGKKREIL
jgi:hypothetical protein